MSKDSYLKRILNRTFFYGFSSILGRIIGFLMLPIYTNYLTPADYGVAGFLVLYVSLAQTLLGARLDQSISKFHYDESVQSPLSSIWTSATVLTTFVGLVPLFLGVMFASELSILLFGSEEYTLAVKIISLNILFGTLEIYGLHYLKIVDLPKLFLIINVVKLLAQLSINIWLVVILEMGVLGVVVSSAAAAILVTIITFTIFAIRERELRIERSLFKPLFVYSLPLWLSGFVGLYTGSIHQVFINYSSGLSDLGLYNLASTFGALTAALALEPFFNYWQVERFRIYERANALEIYQKVFYAITFIALFMSLGIAIYSGPIIELMANESFHPAIDAIVPLCIFNVLMYLGWYMNFSFLVTNNNREIAVNGFIYAAIITVIYALLIPVWGFRGAAYGIMIGNAINFAIILTRAKRFYDINLSITLVLLMIVVTLTLSFLFKHMLSFFGSPINRIMVSTIVIVLGSCVAAYFVYILKPKKMQAFLSQFRRDLQSPEDR